MSTKLERLATKDEKDRFAAQGVQHVLCVRAFSGKYIAFDKQVVQCIPKPEVESA
jgi:hypothetical protein